ncbi:MAG: hypothetical protein HW388_1279 [Dehalococcoidia bacterium]|nr:hypothetical protein [Dehalococcoidia bacterium]
MTESVGSPPACRVMYVGSGRKRVGMWQWEPEREWRQRLATEMEQACQEMSRHGLRLLTVVPVLSAGDMKGGWTEGAWLYFTAA